MPPPGTPLQCDSSASGIPCPAVASGTALRVEPSHSVGRILRRGCCRNGIATPVYRGGCGRYSVMQLRSRMVVGPGVLQFVRKLLDVPWPAPDPYQKPRRGSTDSANGPDHPFHLHLLCYWPGGRSHTAVGCEP